MISIPTSARGALRKELVETIGEQRTKGFLLHYGWHCGVSDALKMREVNWDSPEELLFAGPQMHKLHGYLKEVRMPSYEVDFARKKLFIDGIWENTFEAVEYRELFRGSDEPVCHTLVGYASGYLSTIIGEQVQKLSFPMRGEA